MPKQIKVLKKIVALKRQSAEQHLRSVQSEVERIEAVMRALQSGLDNMDVAKAGFDALRLAEEHGFVPKTLGDLRICQAELDARRLELGAAREALKRAVHSEERLDEIALKG